MQEGEQSEDLFIEGLHVTTSYEALKTLIATMKSTIATNTVYILRVYYNSTQYNSFTVKMMDKIDFSIEKQQTRWSKYRVTFKTNAG